MITRFPLAALAFAAALVVVAAASAAPPPWMYDASSYDVLTYSAWGLQNQISSAECTGTGAAGNHFLGTSHNSFRCDVAVGGSSAGVVTFKALGPESLRVVSISKGTFKPDRGIGAVPTGKAILHDFDAVTALQKSAWAKAHKVTRVLCYGLEPHRATSTSEYYYAFSCATFDARDTRHAQVLVTAAGKNAVRVVRTLIK